MHDTTITRFTVSPPPTTRRTRRPVPAIDRATDRREESKSPAIQRSGLCTTCVHAETCALPFELGLPVLACEEFDSGPVAVADYREPKARRERDGETLAGLCVTCVHRDSCLLPKAEGGVWHCEEFA